MSAVKKLGIIAGQGALPEKLATACIDHAIEPFIIAFEGHEQDALLEKHPHLLTKLGQVGKIIKTLKSNDIRDVVMIGSIKRPSFSQIIPDMLGAKFIAKYALKPLGDDGLLRALREFFEGQGFTLHGVQKFMPQLLTPKGCLTTLKPSDKERADIEHGQGILAHLGTLDIGQSIIVQDGLVLGVEAIEGTDALIQRCAPLKRSAKKSSNGALIKLAKPDQDEDLDLPTCGMKTIRNIHEAGFGGIALQADKSLLIDREAVISFANTHKLFIIGV